MTVTMHRKPKVEKHPRACLASERAGAGRRSAHTAHKRDAFPPVEYVLAQLVQRDEASLSA